MTPLIDADIVLYEAAYKAQQKDEAGELIPTSVEKAYEIFDKIIKDICSDVYATEEPILFLTGKGNFRDNLATRSVYKGNRTKPKPFHYDNLRAYAKATYNCRETNGLEADDLLCIYQHGRMEGLDTIICSRDKDLRIQPGMHYSWEVKGQPRFGPALVKELGALSLKRGGKKIFGTGLRFFYSQCLTGDSTDNIPGVRGYGPIKTFNALVGCQTKEELEQTVRDIYKEAYGDEGDEILLERGRQLWMTKELHEDGSPVLWEIGKHAE